MKFFECCDGWEHYFDLCLPTDIMCLPKYYYVYYSLGILLMVFVISTYFEGGIYSFFFVPRNDMLLHYFHSFLFISPISFSFIPSSTLHLFCSFPFKMFLGFLFFWGKHKNLPSKSSNLVKNFDIYPKYLSE